MIGDLRVISSTSVRRYRDKKDYSIREIGEQLGAGSIVEGSIQRAGDEVLIAARLVDAESDRQIWSAQYKRKLNDVFAIRSEISIAIAQALKANLAPAERAELSRPIVTNLAASDSYYRARGLMSRLGDERNIKEAENALNDAIAADPKFARAYAQMSILQSQAYQWGDYSANRVAAAREAAEKAELLDSELPDTQLALGLYYYRVKREYQKAIPYLKRAQAALPGNVELNADILYALAAVERREGKWESAAKKFAEAAAKKPDEDIYQFNAANTLMAMRRYDEAWAILKPALDRMPQSGPLNFLKGDLFIAWKGDFQAADEYVKKIPNLSSVSPEIALVNKLDLLLLESKFDEALQLLAESEFKSNAMQVRYTTRDGWEAEILTQAGRIEQARGPARRAVEQLAALVNKSPDDARLRMAYAFALAATGDSPEHAVREAEKATQLLPIKRDAFDGPLILSQKGLVLLRTGQVDEAKRIVEQLHKIPSICYDALFRLSPAWAALRKTQAIKN
jgi:tetratricopeptide (TPR) repeat protein